MTGYRSRGIDIVTKPETTCRPEGWLDFINYENTYFGKCENDFSNIVEIQTYENRWEIEL